jgi:hypothetical protein
MTADRDISATQEAVHLLLGDYLIDARHLLGDHIRADDEDPAFEAYCYRARPALKRT